MIVKKNEEPLEYTTQVLQYPNCRVTLHRPILTEEERAKRMEALRVAAVNLVLSTARAKAAAAKEKAKEEAV